MEHRLSPRVRFQPVTKYILAIRNCLVTAISETTACSAASLAWKSLEHRRRAQTGNVVFHSAAPNDCPAPRMDIDSISWPLSPIRLDNPHARRLVGTKHFAPLLRHRLQYDVCMQH